MPRVLHLAGKWPGDGAYQSWATDGRWLPGEVRDVSATVAGHLRGLEGRFRVLDDRLDAPSLEVDDTLDGPLELEGVLELPSSARELARLVGLGDLDDRLGELDDDTRATVRRAVARRRAVLGG